MYCSTECAVKDKNNETFSCDHDHEGEMMNNRVAVAIKICTIYNPAGGIESFFHIEQHASDKTIFDFEKFDRENCLKILASLSIHKMVQYLSTKHPILLQYPADSPFLKSFFFTFGLIDCNSSPYSRLTDRGTIQYGRAVGLFGSLFNHSCDPNVTRINFDDKMVFIVNKPIKAGEQLFIAYRHSFHVTNRNERQSEITGTYDFNCKCKACEENWPQFIHLPKRWVNDFDVPDEIVPSKAFKTVAEMIEQFKKNCKCFNNEENWNFYPNVLMGFLYEYNSKLLLEIANQRL